jgi:hypothetical protein
MRPKLWPIVALAGMWACGGTTGPGLAGDGGSGSGSGSGSSGGSGGSASSSSGSSGSGSGSGGSSGGSSGGGTPCPSQSPQVGAACPLVGLQCEYGSDPNPACDTLCTCEASGWSARPPAPACAAGTCPASYSAVPQRKSCTPAGLDCAYPEGQCNCADTLPVSTGGPVWQCTMPSSGCPEPRPDIGSPCSQPGQSCDYGACAGGAAVECNEGRWQEMLVPCPG